MGWSRGEKEDWVGGEKEMRFGLSKREEDEFGLEERSR